MTATDRTEAVARALEEAGLDALVACSTSFHNFLSTDPVLVLSGFKPMGECAAILARDGRAALIVTPAWDAARAAERSRLKTVVAADDLAEPIARVLAEWKIAPARVGVAGLDALPYALDRRIAAALGDRAAEADALMLDLAKRKSPEEVEYARIAARVAETGYERLKALARPGLHEFELAAELYCAMREAGSDDNFLLVSASQHNLAVRAPSRRILEKGDVILAEITPSWNGQFAQICRSVSIGPPSEKLVENFDLLCRIMRVGMKAAVPGASVAQVTRAMDAVFEQAGYGAYCRPPFMRVRGHGLGRLSSLPGDITVDNETVLEEDMVFVMHPNQYLPETGYLLCGEPVRIAKDGAEPLSSRMAALDWVAA